MRRFGMMLGMMPATIAAVALSPIALAPIALAQPQPAPAAVAAACPASIDRLDAYVRAQMQARHLPGLSLAVVRDGKIARAEAYGLANLEVQAPATTQTVFEIGSISKQFAANAIMLLVEEGKVRLDDPVSKYIDGTPPGWSAITVRHVLTHTAGLADFDTGNIGFSYRREYTPAEFLELLAKPPLQFTPGDRWNYTNAFPLLGMVIERASGQPYMTFVEQRIFTPLKLASMRFKKAQEVVPHRADGYVFENGGYRHGERLRPAVIAPNGGVMTNVLDFAAWDIALDVRPPAEAGERPGDRDAGPPERRTHRQPRPRLVHGRLQRPPLRRALGDDGDGPFRRDPPLHRRSHHGDRGRQRR